MTKHRRNSWQPSRVLVLVGNAGGVEAAKALVKHFGGRRIYIPREPIADNHELVLAIGRPATEVLRDACGGEHIVVPIGRDLKLDIAAEAIAASPHAKRTAIARALGCSYTHAKDILRRLRAHEPQVAANGSIPARRRCDPRQIDLEDLLD